MKATAGLLLVIVAGEEGADRQQLAGKRRNENAAVL
jgi:hypothetical protein